jgi:hypothetical protein
VGGAAVRKTPFVHQFYTTSKTIILSRQARDKHSTRKGTQKTRLFFRRAYAKPPMYGTDVFDNLPTHLYLMAALHLISACYFLKVSGERETPL